MGDDLRMKALADTCRHCAESCEAMAAGHEAPRRAGASHAGATGGPRRTGAVLTRGKTR
jgi:hypothetical protein